MLTRLPVAFGVCAALPTHRISLPALPKGVLQLVVLDANNRPCFMQHVLVLPALCAQELNMLWSQLLRGQIRIKPPPAEAAVAGSASAGSASRGTSTSSSSSTAAQSSSAVPAATGSAASAAGVDAAGQPKARLSPEEIQAIWRNSFNRVLTDMAAVLLAKGSSVPPSPAAAAAAAVSSPAEPRLRPSFDTPEMRDRVGSLVHFFATNGKWAVLELLTTHVYGTGSLCRAMYASKTLAAAAATVATAATATAAGDAGAGTGSLSSAPGQQAVSGPGAVADAPAGAAASPAPGSHNVLVTAQQQQLQHPAQSEIQPDDSGHFGVMEAPQPEAAAAAAQPVAELASAPSAFGPPTPPAKVAGGVLKRLQSKLLRAVSSKH